MGLEVAAPETLPGTQKTRALRRVDLEAAAKYELHHR